MREFMMGLQDQGSQLREALRALLRPKRIPGWLGGFGCCDGSICVVFGCFADLLQVSTNAVVIT